MRKDRKHKKNISELHVMLLYFLTVFMCSYTQQFRDATLELLSCGRYIPHAPTSVSINMRSLNRRSRLTSLSRSTHSKVLPLELSRAKTRSCHGCQSLSVPHQ